MSHNTSTCKLPNCYMCADINRQQRAKEKKSYDVKKSSDESDDFFYSNVFLKSPSSWD